MVNIKMRCIKGANMGDMARESSMEEILSSIRRVIAREEGDSDVQPSADRETVLELTDGEIGIKGGADSAALAIDESTSDLDILEASDSLDALDEDKNSGARTAGMTSPFAEDTHEAALVATPVAKASRDTLSALSALIAKPQPQDTPVSAPGLTVDALVRDALRPLLKDWLDANLPEIVEAMVAKEIARITGRNF
jgi:hypothetical protein